MIITYLLTYFATLWSMQVYSSLVYMNSSTARANPLELLLEVTCL